MAKLFKVTMYVTDSSDTYEDAESLTDDIERHLDDVMLTFAKVKESDHIEWHDDIDINYTDASLEDYEKYLKE